MGVCLMRIALFVAAAALAAAGIGHAQSFQNGDFSDNDGAGQIGYNTSLVGWTVAAPGATYLYGTGTADAGVTTGANGPNDLWGEGNGGATLIPDAPAGSGWFVAQGAGSSALKQTITGLTKGATYVLNFNYAYAQKYGAFGPTQLYWAVKLGNGQTEYTPLGTNPSKSFTGWFNDGAISFKATAATQVLSFAAFGTNGQAFAALDGVTITEGQAPGPPPTVKPVIPMTAGKLVNGNFASNGGVGQINFNTAADGWYLSGAPGYTFIYATGQADICCTNGQYGDNELWGKNNGGPKALSAPPRQAAYFVAQDGAFQVVPISQDLTRLTVGGTYKVNFDYAFAQQAGFLGDTQQNWCVSLGGAAQCTPTVTNLSQSSTAWSHGSFTFVAGAAAETLSFLASGSPADPPFALLANVSFNPVKSVAGGLGVVAAVPEPDAWALMIVGLGALGLSARRRRGARAVTV